MNVNLALVHPLIVNKAGPVPAIHLFTLAKLLHVPDSITDYFSLSSCMNLVTFDSSSCKLIDMSYSPRILKQLWKHARGLPQIRTAPLFGFISLYYLFLANCTFVSCNCEVFFKGCF